MEGEMKVLTIAEKMRRKCGRPWLGLPTKVTSQSSKRYGQCGVGYALGQVGGRGRTIGQTMSAQIITNLFFPKLNDSSFVEPNKNVLLWKVQGFLVKHCGRSERKVALHCLDVRHTAAININHLFSLFFSSSSSVLLFFCLRSTCVVSCLCLSGSRVVCSLVSLSNCSPLSVSSSLSLISHEVLFERTHWDVSLRTHLAAHTKQHAAHMTEHTTHHTSPTHHHTHQHAHPTPTITQTPVNTH